MAKSTSKLKYCQECREASSEEFRKVLELKRSGLVLYKHEDQDAKSSKKTRTYMGEAYLLHNIADRDVKRPVFINELCSYKTKCMQCTNLVQRVRSLLDQLDEIRGDQVVGVCCYCKRYNASNKCKRCEYLVNKFYNHKIKQYEVQEKRFRAWLDKVKILLETVLEGETICKHKLDNVTSAKELENLLQQIKKPLSIREPEIGAFLSESKKCSSLVNLGESKDMLEELTMKIKVENNRKSLTLEESSNTCSPKEGSCICKYFMKNKNEDLKTFKAPSPNNNDYDLLTRRDLKDIKQTESMQKITSLSRNLSDNIKVHTNKLRKSGTKSLRGKENVSPITKKIKPIIEVTKEKIQKSVKEKQSHAEIKNSKFINTRTALSEEMMLTLIREREKEKVKPKQKTKMKDILKFPEFGDLPVAKVIHKKYHLEEISASTIECGNDHLKKPLEMIKGERIEAFDPHYRNENTASDKQPLLFKVTDIYPDPLLGIVTPQATMCSTPTAGCNKSRQLSPLEHSKGVIKYELSNTEYIEKGWTKLPTEKIMRKMNIYKVLPSNPQFDWFTRHQNKKEMYYASGQKFADFDKDGRAKLYYKNGRVALEYNKAQEELNAGQRCIVYSSGEEIENGKFKTFTVLASFDFFGNGIVYDSYGKIRLKYNQSEGMIIDDKIGPPGRWKWHTLNEPPLIQSVFIDTHNKNRDPCLDELLKNERDREAASKMKDDNTDMLAIELENLVKEKAHKMFQKFKPFEFRVKVLKINNQFSLRILDQANIYVRFREGSSSVKLNLGMILISNEIVDTVTAEMSEVATPYDKYAPKVQRIADSRKI